MMRVISLALALALLSGPASAHHSFAMFDSTKSVTLDGTVENFKWSNPHAWLDLQVAGRNGVAEHWSVELTSPNNLVHQGWKRTSLRPGDKVRVFIRPLTSGKNGGALYKVRLADGTELSSARSENGGNAK